MKLKHRLSILIKTIVAEQNAATTTIFGKNVPAVMPTAVGAMILIAQQTSSPGHFQSLPTQAIISHVNATAAKFGYYQRNSVTSLAKTLKAAGTNKSPRDIANEINKHGVQSLLVV
ncbi:probable arginine--tRNA ligase, cytoplasmic [Rhagoletis pomonella]|uniref:probable arginine--tRNA ligase, cytoplasmic n=1 Tax=Rhagoletis pomonella TaxID=28610 RepID=UPI00178356F5|nr:probable arginine--tRNA ligase, cytoplasmic [Rhagoletis pomonella]